MGFDKQTIFDRINTHRDKISDVIEIDKFQTISKVRKVNFIDNIDIYVPENFVCIVRGIMNDGSDFESWINYEDIPFYDENINNIRELRYTFINLNPSIMDIDSLDLQIMHDNIIYDRQYDMFMLGMCSHINIFIIEGKIDSYSYNYLYTNSIEYVSMLEDTVWIYEYGKYVNE